MFDNATMFMMFILLCFAGLLVMFYFVLRGMDELARGIRDEHAMLASGLRTLEARVNELARAQRAAAAGLPPTAHADPAHDAFDEPAGQYHVQYGTGPDARTDTGYGAGGDPLYGLVQEADDASSLPGGLGMDFEEPGELPVELVDRHEDTATAHAAQDVELPRLDLPGSGAPRGRDNGLANGLDASTLDTSAFGGAAQGQADARDARPAFGASESDLLSFGDDAAAYREGRERRTDARASRGGKGNLPDLKLDD
ncbi:hypothetical protein RVX_R17660 [Nitratidesulfovibrio sp. HK-II]|uniref:hypothetical protein n=1 Tax=Nitratidesulfovibrio sp. HK-II TaxID=2009266 RepID=UPI000E2F2A8E|nr:hypothetical protein [Nitratidesulfovibrio sp. HK-II]GBO96104.1 hypothetical protein RVX_1144 [Nitratidesulfovibrio sp. HK-II]